MSKTPSSFLTESFSSSQAQLWKGQLPQICSFMCHTGKRSDLDFKSVVLSLQDDQEAARMFVFALMLDPQFPRFYPPWRLPGKPTKLRHLVQLINPV